MEKLKTLERPGLILFHHEVIANEDRTHRGKIPGWAENQFFNLAKPICDKKGWKIEYEPKTFRVKYFNGVVMSTAPDFVITRPNQKTLCIELERSFYDPTIPYSRDPKIRQKRIMSNFSDEYVFVVLYKQHMDKIEKKHSPISFKPPNSRHSKRDRLWKLLL